MLLLDILLVQLSSCPLSSCFKRHWICFRHWIGYLEIKAPHTTVTTYQFSSNAADQPCCWWEVRLLSLPRTSGSTECLVIGRLYNKGSTSLPLQQHPLSFPPVVHFPSPAICTALFFCNELNQLGSLQHSTKPAVGLLPCSLCSEDQLLQYFPNTGTVPRGGRPLHRWVSAQHFTEDANHS